MLISDGMPLSNDEVYQLVMARGIASRPACISCLSCAAVGLLTGHGTPPSSFLRTPVVDDHLVTARGICVPPRTDLLSDAGRAGQHRSRLRLKGWIIR